MSLTSVLHSSQDKPSKSILLNSPSKQERLRSRPGPSGTRASTSSKPSVPTAKETVIHSPSNAEILKWTLTQEAIAPCFVKDIYDLKDNGLKDQDFFWLGRVPCRVGRLVGMIVGIDVYEKKTMYTFDDGSGVLECLHQHPPQPKKVASPRKRGGSPENKLARYDPLANYRVPRVASTSQVKPKTEIADFPMPFQPPVDIGQLVRIEGRVVPWHDTRRIYVNSLEPCSSLNDEAKHWSTVLQLHRTRYSGDEPFTLPPPAPVLRIPLTILPPSVPTSIPQTPSNRRETNNIDPAFTASSVASSSAQGSPTKSTRSGLPPRLRHPTRISREHLTGHTFRLHLKHYMEHAPVFLGLATSAWESDDPDSVLKTPTRTRIKDRNAHLGSPTTPTVDHTPRPKPMAASIHEPGPELSATRGFTLSHLRRIPELAVLGARIVRAEARNRAKEEKTKSQATSTSSRPPRPSEPLAKKLKRLFSSTLVKLHKEGLIILLEGPAWSVPVDETSTNLSAGLWKDATGKASQTQTQGTSASLSISTSTSSVTSRSLDSRSISMLDEDLGELSDPPPDETVYMPITPHILAEPVLKAIGILADQDRQRARTARPSQAAGKGATAITLASYLRRVDEQWVHVGEWIVEDTLALLQARGEIWRVEDGKWELCV